MQYKPQHRQISSLYGITTIKWTIANCENVTIAKNGAVWPRFPIGYSLLVDTVHVHQSYLMAWISTIIKTVWWENWLRLLSDLDCASWKTWWTGRNYGNEVLRWIDSNRSVRGASNELCCTWWTINTGAQLLNQTSPQRMVTWHSVTEVSPRPCIERPKNSVYFKYALLFHIVVYDNWHRLRKAGYWCNADRKIDIIFKAAIVLLQG